MFYNDLNRQLGIILSKLDTIERAQAILILQGRKEMAQIDDLNTIVGTLGATISSVAADQAAVLAELTSLQGQTSPDLSGVIATLTSANANLATLDTSLKAAEPQTPPTSIASTPATVA